MRHVFIFTSIFCSLFLSIAAVEIFFIANAKYHFLNAPKIKFNLTQNSSQFNSLPQFIIDDLIKTYKSYPVHNESLRDELNSMRQFNIRTAQPELPSSYIQKNNTQNKTLLLQDTSYNQKLDRIIFSANYGHAPGLVEI